jgi:hypothetical protein
MREPRQAWAGLVTAGHWPWRGRWAEAMPGGPFCSLDRKD